MTDIQPTNDRKEADNNVVSEVEQALQEQLSKPVWEHLPGDVKAALIQSDLKNRDMNENMQQPLTREQVAQKYQWSTFPEEIQKRLFEHYQTFTHEGDLKRAESDLQSATNTLDWLLSDAHIDTCLAEHQAYFGEASAKDTARIAKELHRLKRHTDEQRENLTA